jgi:hypothetical protein
MPLIARPREKVKSMPEMRIFHCPSGPVVPIQSCSCQPAAKTTIATPNWLDTKKTVQWFTDWIKDLLADSHGARCEGVRGDVTRDLVHVCDKALAHWVPPLLKKDYVVLEDVDVECKALPNPALLSNRCKWSVILQVNSEKH